jgi:iron(III) transport system substrate-binding protein
MNPTKLLRLLFAAFVVVSVTGSIAAGELTLYTQRHYEFDEKLHKLFTERTGISIVVVKAASDELMARLQSEGDRTPADLFLTADGGGLDRAKKADLLQPLPDPAMAKDVPSTLKDADHQWVAVTMRARVLYYSPDRVNAGELSSYEDLSDPKWRGRLAARSSSNAYNQSLMATLVEANGPEKAKAWAAAVRGNMVRPPQGGDRDQIRVVAAGLADVAIANTYYLGLLATSEDAQDREAAAKVKIHFPNQDGRGTHVNISGAGIVKASKKAADAAKFLAFLLSDEIQGMIAENTFEYPVTTTAKRSEIQKSWGEFKADAMPFSVLGERNAEAVRLFDESGWE